MAKIELVRRLAAPPQPLGDLFTDHASWSQWAGYRKAWLVREGEPEKNGRGAIRGMVAPNGAEIREEILDFEPPRRVTYTMTQSPLPIKDHLTEVLLEPDGDGTRLVWRCRFKSRVPGLGWIFRLMMTPVFKDLIARLEKAATAK